MLKKSQFAKLSRYTVYLYIISDRAWENFPISNFPTIWYAYTLYSQLEILLSLSLLNSQLHVVINLIEQSSWVKKKLLQQLDIINFCSITNKQSKLEVILTVRNIHFLLGTESHLDESVTNSEVVISKSCTFTYRKTENLWQQSIYFG